MPIRGGINIRRRPLRSPQPFGLGLTSLGITLPYNLLFAIIYNLGILTVKLFWIKSIIVLPGHELWEKLWNSNSKKNLTLCRLTNYKAGKMCRRKFKTKELPTLKKFTPKNLKFVRTCQNVMTAQKG